MCGIWALFGYKCDISPVIHNALKIARRGPDFFRIETVPHYNNTYLAFHRLSIMDDTHGQQPMRLQRLHHLHLMYNGEIYNYTDLVKKYAFQCETNMDGEVILHLYNKFGFEKTMQLLDGVFAASIFDAERGEFHFGRDTFGIRPLFTMLKPTGELGICSEAKGLIDIAIKDVETKVHPFKPGMYATYKICPDSGKATLIVEKRFTDVDVPQVFDIPVKLTENIKENIRNLFIDAVRKRLMSERRLGCMLSGGLDSSLVAALVVKLAREQGFEYPIQTFSIGFPNSPDVKAAKKVAEMLGTEHHEVPITSDEAFASLKDVIYTTETYDITTIRSSVCMYLLSKYISEKTDTVVIFSGEGSDELTQGYIYYHNAPSADEALEDSKRLLRNLYLHDNIRADRNVAAHGLELRLPFLDKAFTSYYLTIPKEMIQPQKGIEKYLLRSAFDGYLKGLIPDDVLWRPKEAFSDGVASVNDSWPVQLKLYTASFITEEEVEIAKSLYSVNTPKTPESLFYRRIFEENFPDQSQLTPYFWLPRWMGDVTDPSQRMLTNYTER